MRARGILTAVLAGAVTLLAALAASGRRSFHDWDYVRVAGVDGRDREVIPDGALCSGGVPGFAGLDLARADWPTTQVRAGAELTFSYRTTIPHQGEFRLHVTKDGYDSAEPLAWSDLEAEPFLTVTDPELVDDAYRLPGQLPDGKTGRHVVFTIWQNFDTPDTYYACSDVDFGSPVSERSATVWSSVGGRDRAGRDGRRGRRRAAPAATRTTSDRLMRWRSRSSRAGVAPRIVLSG